MNGEYISIDTTKKIADLENRIDKAISLYENCKEEDYCILAIEMYQILKGENK